MKGRIPQESKELEVAPAVENDILPDLTELHCPIDCTPLGENGKHITIGSDGHFYNAEAISEWLRTNPTSPFDRRLLLILEEASPAVTRKIKNIYDELKGKLNLLAQKFSMQDKIISSSQGKIKTLEAELQIFYSIHKQLEKNIEGLRQDKVLPAETSIPDVSMKKSFNNSRFMRAIKEYKIAEVRYYAKEGADINTLDHDSGESALMIVSRLRQLNPLDANKMMFFLCDELNVDINLPDGNGNSVLHIAAERNDEWAVDFLLTRGANPLQRNVLGKSPRDVGLSINGDRFNKNIAALLMRKEEIAKETMYRSADRKPTVASRDQLFTGGARRQTSLV